MRKHLVVIQADGSRNCDRVDPEEHDFRWGAGYLTFVPVKVRWHDDRSYGAYQAQMYDD